MRSPVTEDNEIKQEFLEAVPAIRDNLLNEIHKAVVGQDEILEHLLISLACDSHSILVGVPGLAKTRMVRSLARAFDLEFNRIQFTPDLMPSDITGTDILQEGGNGRHFEFRKGPVFTDILLADEINRTPPKTQSALLQAMQEREITASGKTYQLSSPFFVLATQNPIEQEGTYPLPEAQLDRFMFLLKVDYPDAGEELDVVNMTTGSQQGTPQAVVDRETLLELQRAVRHVPADESLMESTVNLVRLTRPTDEHPLENIKEWIRWGAGPRASQYLILAGKARALLDGRDYVSRDDIQSLAVPVLRHRIVRSFTAESENIQSEQIIQTILRHWNDSPA